MAHRSTAMSPSIERFPSIVLTQPSPNSERREIYGAALDMAFRRIVNFLANVDRNQFKQIVSLHTGVHLETFDHEEFRELVSQAFPPLRVDLSKEEVQAITDAKIRLDERLVCMERIFDLVGAAGTADGTIRSSLAWLAKRNRDTYFELTWRPMAESSAPLMAPMPSNQVDWQSHNQLPPIFPSPTTETFPHDNDATSVALLRSPPHSKFHEPRQTIEWGNPTPLLSPLKAEFTRPYTPSHPRAIDVSTARDRAALTKAARGNMTSPKTPSSSDTSADDFLFKNRHPWATTVFLAKPRNDITPETFLDRSYRTRRSDTENDENVPLWRRTSKVPRAAPNGKPSV